MMNDQPISFRVWWEHHSIKLTSNKPPEQEFKDFTTEEEAVAFKRAQSALAPHSVFCLEKIFADHDLKPRGGTRRRRR